MNARTTARRGADSALIFEHLENRLLLSGCTQPFFGVTDHWDRRPVS